MNRATFGMFSACAAVVLLTFQAALGQEGEVTNANLPTVKFFYFDGVAVEWVVSDQTERFEQHLASNPESQALYSAASSAVATPAESTNSAGQMTRWIEGERARFEQSRREPARIRMAEGIIAYLRDHDFNIQKLVEALKHRSGASDVELVAVHLRDRQGSQAFKLKVVLVRPQITVGKQGFNIDLPTANANYTTVAYALGVALYNVQEIIHGASSGEDTEENRAIEQLPAPEPVEARVRDDPRARNAG
jgi:hypothetical protein